MIIKAKEISIEIKEESIKKFNEWKSNLNPTLFRADVVYETDTYVVKAYYCASSDRVYIYSQDKNSAISEVSNFLGVGAPKEFKAGGYYILPITFSEEATIYADGFNINFVDYRDCLMALSKIIDLDIRLVSDNTKEEIPF